MQKDARGVASTQSTPPPGTAAPCAAMLLGRLCERLRFVHSLQKRHGAAPDRVAALLFGSS
eukprot:363521-Chlamydomonas_euryale.AAC.6